MWKLFLSRFKFVRELLGTNSDDMDAKLSQSRSGTAKESKATAVRKVRLE